MGVAERKERQRAELREQILSAARTIVAEDGYEGLTMRRIAERIEYSPATIYLYFENRDEIGRQLVREAFNALLEQLAPAARIADPVERLRAIGEAYLAFGRTCPEQYALVFMIDRRYTEVVFGGAKESDDPGNRAFAFLAETVAEAQQAGRLRPGDSTGIAEMLWCSLHGIIAMRLTCDEAVETPAPALEALTIETMLRGLTP